MDGITNSMSMRLSKLQELVMDSKSWSAIVHGLAKSQTLSRVSQSLSLIVHYFRRNPFLL